MSQQIINYRRIEKAIVFLIENFKSQPNLDDVARKINLSPFHFHRLFIDWIGISPKRYLQYLTIDYLRTKIHMTANNIEAAELVGLSSQSRVNDWFVRIEGVSPFQFKKAGLGLDIFYGYHPTPFGMCFIAVTKKGICNLRFIDERIKRDEFERFTNQWHSANIIHKPDITQEYIARIFDPAKVDAEQLHLITHGTDFQVKVWEALVQIPFGSPGTPHKTAQFIGIPVSSKSIVLAVEKDPVSFPIPSRRIICYDGSIGEYHRGEVRKRAMIAWEQAKSEALQEPD